MFKNIFKGLITLLGGALGWVMGGLLLNIDIISKLGLAQTQVSRYVIYGLMALLFAFLFFILSPFFIRHILGIIDTAEKAVQKIPLPEVLLAAMGGLLSLAIFYLIVSRSLDKINIFWQVVSVIGNLIAFFIGANISIKKKEEISQFFTSLGKNRNLSQAGKQPKKSEFEGDPKVLDTSVIIDGRIFDICKTGFVEGTLIIPYFVLEELRHIADSSDSLKRNRGRRGLDILNRIQKELDIDVRIWDKDVKDAKEVDIKLLKLAKELGGKVVTNDYNLNKVAEFQGVPVLNINELANAVKPILLPGEEMSILVSKVGKEMNQGIAYLDDGTMIVIENGKRYVNETIDVVVTSILQTAAGRMIFARPKDEKQY